MVDHRELVASEKVYGYFFFGFKPIVKVGREGVVVRGKVYRWDEIKEFDFSYSLIGPPIGIPRAVLTFSDGSKLKINVPQFREKEGVRQPGFISGITPAFSEFAHLVKMKAGVGDPLQWGI